MQTLGQSGAPSLGLLCRGVICGGLLLCTSARAQDAVPATGGASESAPADQSGATGENSGDATKAEGPDAAASESSSTETTAETVEEGATVSRVQALQAKGYFRTEVKYNALNLFYAYDEVLGAFTPRGSPYLAFAMLPPADHDSYLEVNTELRWKPMDGLSGYADLSAVYSTTAPVQTTFEQAQDLIISTGDLSADQEPDYGVSIPGAAGGQFSRKAQERLTINEIYLNVDVPDIAALTLGKRRMFYGSAFIWSPMDVINPPRNPLEPTLLREGSYNAVLDINAFPSLTLSFLYRPKVEVSERGLPESVDFAKSLALGRAYANLFETDINLVGYWNEGRPYLGLSLSRYFDLVEVHSEMLFQQGRPTWLSQYSVDPTDPLAALLPPYVLGQTQVDNGKLYADILLGATYTSDDSSFLIVEYQHHGAGLTADEYQAHRGVTAWMQEELPHVVPQVATASSGLSEEDQTRLQDAWLSFLEKAPFIYQESLIRQNYLGITYMKSKLFDLIEPKISVVFNLDDLSGTLYPSMDFVLARNSGGKGTVKLMAGAMVFFGAREAQVGFFPNQWSANLRMTALY